MSVLPYLPKDVKFYDAKCVRFYRHYAFETCYTQNKDFEGADAIYVSMEKFRDRLSDVVLLLNFKINLDAVDYLELQYASPEIAIHTQETFFIYKFKPSPEAHALKTNKGFLLTLK